MGKEGDALAGEVRALMAQAITPVLIHDQRQPSAGGAGAPVEFDRFFHVTPYGAPCGGRTHDRASLRPLLNPICSPLVDVYHGLAPHAIAPPARSGQGWAVLEPR